MKKKRVIILTGKTGGGHLSAAEGYKFWLTQWGYGTEVYDILPKSSDKFLELIYKNPTTYRSLYKLADQPALAEAVVEAFNLEMERRIKKVIPDIEEADMVISTHGFVHPKTGNLKIMLLPDPGMHSVYFAPPKSDYYLAFWEEILKEAKKYKVNPKKIIYTGSLARPAFYEYGKTYLNDDFKKSFKEKNKIPQDHLLILVLAGSAWINRAKRHLPFLYKAFKNQKVTLVFLCGKNKAFIKEVAEEYPKKPNFRFFGWLNEEGMASWMAAADCGIAFSLAQMSAEAGLMRLPLFAFRLIEGQEDGYKEVIENNKVGIFVPGQPEDQVAIFKSLLKHLDSLFAKNLKIWQKELLASPERTKKTLDSLLKRTTP